MSIFDYAPMTKNTRRATFAQTVKYFVDRNTHKWAQHKKDIFLPSDLTVRFFYNYLQFLSLRTSIYSASVQK